MRYTAIVVMVAVIVLGVMFGGSLFSSKTEYVISEPEVIKEEVKVDALEKAISEAQEAKKVEIESVAQKAYDDAYAQEMRKVELEVIKTFNTKLDDRQKNLEKQTNDYWRGKGVIVRLIKETFKDDAERALAVARCESNLNPFAQSHTNDGGIFQINLTAHGERLEALGLDVFNPEDNIKFAKILYDADRNSGGDGFRDWVCAWSTEHLAFSQKR